MPSPSLLEPIASGQTRFRLQGLTLDARGIAIGREIMVVLPSLDRLVGFLGAYSEESSLDELLSTMTIERAKREGGGHALLIQFAQHNSYALDRLAQLATAMQGSLYIGGGTTFVRYRDRLAPFGYDVAQPVTVNVEQVLVIDTEFSARYHPFERIDPVDLIQRLSLRSMPIPLAGISASEDFCGLAELALVLVAPGLTERVLSYLWKAKVPTAGVPLALRGDRSSAMLLRLRRPPGPILDILYKLPGVELFVPISERVAVEVGYRHPIHLASASSCLPGEDMYLFRGRVGRVERFEGAPQFIEDHYLFVSQVQAQDHQPHDIRILTHEPIRLSLRLVPSSEMREPQGTLVSWSQTELLRRLMYLLPPASLAAAKLAIIPQGILILTGPTLEGHGFGLAAGVGAGALIPLGTRICEVAPGVFLPDGFELRPRLRPPFIRKLVGLEGSDCALFTSPEESPLRLAPHHFTPLDVGLLSRLQLQDSEAIQTDFPKLKPASIHNLRLGRFALWGFGKL